VSIKAVRWKGRGLWREGFKEKVFFDFRVEKLPESRLVYHAYRTKKDNEKKLKKKKKTLSSHESEPYGLGSMVGRISGKRKFEFRVKRSKN